jgi:Chromo (CHRromatin Organisation MOdifier) domain
MDTEQKAREILRCVGAGKLWDSFESSTIEGICEYICDGFTPTPKQIESVENVYEKCNIATRLRKHDKNNRMSNFRMMLPKASKCSTESSVASSSSFRVAKPNKCITIMANRTVGGFPTATQYCGRHKPEEPKVNPVNSTNKCITVRKNKTVCRYLAPSPLCGGRHEFAEKEERMYFEQSFEEDRIAKNDHLEKTSFVTLPKASNLSVPPLVPLEDPVPILSIKVLPKASETYIQEEEIPLQKHKRKHPRKYMIVDDEDEEQEVQVPRRSTRVQPYSKVVFEDDDEEQEVYEIKEIIGIQNNPISGEVQYLISWKGYTSKSNSWEPKENLVGADCPKLINKFIRNNKI